MENWFGEKQTDDVMLSMKYDRILFHKKSKYQMIDLIENKTYGKVLFIDNTFQLTERDEFIYHEMLAHIALFSIERPKKVLIIGGGDGGLARECLKHDIDDLKLVEIDEDVVNVSKKFLPSLSVSFNDSKMKIFIDDGAEFIKNSNEKFDAVLIDSTDPVGPAAVLFETEFYNNIKKILNNGGIVGTQSGSPFMFPEHLKKAYGNMRKIFNFVKVYTATIPTYPGAIWSFTFASNNDIIRKREVNVKTKYYNEKIHDCNCNPKFIDDIVQ
ncbi:MAG: polyamine aminopropyltransferase [Thermoplasmata archaeon]|nr:polyamine aminopropyltransferase [Thermoplasmata archaeon]